MSVGPTTTYSTGASCTCASCPVHGKPSCPACGARGAHYCPGPSAPYREPYTNRVCKCGKTGVHVCWTVQS